MKTVPAAKSINLLRAGAYPSLSKRAMIEFHKVAGSGLNESRIIRTYSATNIFLEKIPESFKTQTRNCLIGEDWQVLNILPP